MSERFSCKIGFNYDPDSQQLEIHITPDRAIEDLIERKTIKLENPDNLTSSIDFVLKEFRTMLPRGMAMGNSEPLIELLVEILSEEREDA